MTFALDPLAAALSATTGHSRAEWRAALENARLSLKPTDVDDAALERIAAARADRRRNSRPSQIDLRLRKTAPWRWANGQKLIAAANESRFSLADWIDAIDLGLARTARPDGPNLPPC